MVRFKLAILIPAFNEQETIGTVVLDAGRYGDVYVVDDGSEDNTASIARKFGASVLSPSKNLGYDGAIHFGLERIQGMHYDGIITMDADGQHIAEDISKIANLLQRGCDLAVGKRPQMARFMETVFSKVSEKFWSITDPLSGMKGYSVSALTKLGLTVNYNSVGTQLTFKALAFRMNVIELGISCNPRIGAPRFAGKMRANLLILRALIVTLIMFLVWRSRSTRPVS